MASLRYKASQFSHHVDETGFLESHQEIGVREWNRTNEVLLRDLGRVIFDMMAMECQEPEENIIWN
ncbi:MAG TPA: hypothetical protein VN944_02345 [Nitrospiria bacterium]|nr:hypothetical protein [Nitrospiria bacterium]